MYCYLFLNFALVRNETLYNVHVHVYNNSGDKNNPKNQFLFTHAIITFRSRESLGVFWSHIYPTCTCTCTLSIFSWNYSLIPCTSNSVHNTYCTCTCTLLSFVCMYLSCGYQ